MATDCNQSDQRTFSTMSVSFSEDSIYSMSSESVNDILDDIDNDPLESALSFNKVGL